MQDLLAQNVFLWFPVFFVALWLFVTYILGFASGWFRLMERYPDRADEKPLQQLWMQSGQMGWVSMRGVLHLSACRSGLRVSMLRIFGAFQRPYLVPWRDITVRRKDRWLVGQVAELEFGNPKIANLTVSARVADRLAQASDQWPERTRR